MTTSLLPSICNHCDFEIVPNWKNFRSYGFCCLVYQDWEHLHECMRRIMNLPCKYFGISPIHDKDFLSNGKPDKPHYHVILRFPNARSAHQVARDYLLTCKLEPLKNFRGAVRYFVHFDNPEKFLYCIDDIVCSDYEKTFSFFNDLLTKDNSDEFDEMTFIDTMNWLIQKGEFRTELDMISWILKHGYSRFFNRYKFALHNTFSDMQKQYYIKNKKIERSNNL